MENGATDGATSVENWCSARTNNVRPAQPTYARSQASSMVPALHRSLCNCRQASLAGISMAALLIHADPTTSTGGWPPANAICWSCRCLKGKASDCNAFDLPWCDRNPPGKESAAGRLSHGFAMQLNSSLSVGFRFIQR